MKKVYIAGLTGAGKGLLRPLLDGHPQILDCPFQGFGAFLLQDKFLGQKSEPTILMIRLMQEHASVRKITVHEEPFGDITYTMGDLISSMFQADALHMFVECAMGRIIHASSSLNKIRFVDFDFDLFAFLKSFCEDAAKISHFASIEDLQDCFYACFVRHWKNICPYQPGYSFVQTAKTGWPVIETILRRNKNRKVIVVFRDPIALSYRNAKNQVLKYHGPISDSEVQKLLRGKRKGLLYSVGFVDKVRNFQDRVRKEQQVNPDLQIVQFDDLVFKTRETMDSIADFLGISKSEVLYKPTLNGASLDEGDLQFTGKVNDDPYKSLESDQLDLLKTLYGEGSGKTRWMGAALRVKYALPAWVKR